jgi:hypothetical protein
MRAAQGKGPGCRRSPNKVHTREAAGPAGSGGRREGAARQPGVRGCSFAGAAATERPGTAHTLHRPAAPLPPPASSAHCAVLGYIGLNTRSAPHMALSLATSSLLAIRSFWPSNTAARAVTFDRSYFGGSTWPYRAWLQVSEVELARSRAPASHSVPKSYLGARGRGGTVGWSAEAVEAAAGGRVVLGRPRLTCTARWRGGTAGSNASGSSRPRWTPRWPRPAGEGGGGREGRGFGHRDPLPAWPHRCSGRARAGLAAGRCLSPPPPAGTRSRALGRSSGDTTTEGP